MDVSLGPRGLHGEAYRGLAMWDDLYVFPVLDLRLPEVTRDLLKYRYRRLPEARRMARRDGLRGAMFPWQCGSNGEEMAQKIHLNPKSGRWIPDVTNLQRHVGLAIARNVSQYHDASGDDQFMEDYGAELLFEIARFFGSLASFDAARGRYAIRGVLGPDEFHTGYPGVETPGLDNNAYTNVMAAWLFGEAARLPAQLTERRAAELTDTLGIDDDELARWEELSRKLIVPFHDDGVISQFEGYEQARGARLGGLPGEATATSTGSTGSSRPRTTPRTATSSPSRPTRSCSSTCSRATSSRPSWAAWATSCGPSRSRPRSTTTSSARATARR